MRPCRAAIALAALLLPPAPASAADATLREHTWKRSAFSGTEIFGKTVGVVGLGRIGQLVAQRLAAFGAHITAYDPYVSHARAAQLGIELLTLDELLGRADFISVHLPKTKETAGLIGTEALAKTKPGVIIVNAARGGLIDEDAWSLLWVVDAPLFESADEAAAAGDERKILPCGGADRVGVAGMAKVAVSVDVGEAARRATDP